MNEVQFDELVKNERTHFKFLMMSDQSVISSLSVFIEQASKLDFYLTK